jgi:hypothetical protein
MVAFMLTLGSASWAQQQAPDCFTHSIIYGSSWLCWGGSVVLSGPTNTNNLSYYWSTGETTPSITITQPGVYWLGLGTCSSTAAQNRDTIVVTQVPLIITPTVSTVSASVCPNTTTTITANSTSSNITYQWYKEVVSFPVAYNPIGGATSNTLEAGEGVYVVKAVSYYGGCTSEYSQRVTVTVSNPPVAPTVTAGSSVLCNSSATTTLTASNIAGATYQWKKNGSIIAGNSTNVLTNAGIGNYEVRLVTAPGFACGSSWSAINIVLGASPTNISLTSSNTCEMKFATPTLANATSYTWQISNVVGGTQAPVGTTSGNTFTVKHYNATSFLVTVRANYACGASSNFASFSATPIPLPTLIFNSQAKTVSCPWGTRIEFTGTYNGTAAIPSHSWVNIKAGTVNPTSYTTSVSGRTIKCFAWFPSYPVGAVTATVVSTNGVCNDDIKTLPSATLVVDGLTSCETIPPGQEEARKGLGEMIDMSLYPNPASKTFTLSMPEDAKETTVSLIDALGKERKNLAITAGENTISLEGIPAGLYHVKVKTTHGVATKTLVVQ